MATEEDVKEEDVSNGTSDHTSTPKKRRSQQLAEAIRMRNTQDTKVADYEELDKNAIKYLGKWQP
jgi:hypothetical protein